MRPNRIRDRRESKGMTQEELAAALGTTKTTISRLERGNQPLTTDWMKQIASALGCTQADLLAESPLPSEVVPASNHTPVMGGGLPRDVPVLGITIGGDDGDFSLNGEVVDYVRRPPGIATNKSIYALYVSGGSMSPWREPGEIVYVDPQRPPRAGDYVVVQMKPKSPGDAPHALVKRLVSRTPKRLHLMQFHPEKQLELPGTDVQSVHRVVPWDELIRT